jgi:hypothetical protein
MSKLSVYEVYGQDKEYQDFMNEFAGKRARFEEMARQGIYNKEHLKEVARKLGNDLQNFLQEHKNKRLHERQEKMESLKNKAQKFGLAERSADVEEFKMRFKLADDYELKRLVEELATTDTLELNLLRMELKSRGLDKEDLSGRNHDAMVKRYIAENINKMDDAEQKEYERLQEEATIYRSMGVGFIVGDNSFTTTSTIQQELTKAANSVPDYQKIKRNVPAELFNL